LHVLRCPICSAAARRAETLRVRNVRVARCGACFHEFALGRDAGRGSREVPDAWHAIEQGARRLFGLRAFGVCSGKLLCLDHDRRFCTLAAAGPFEVSAPLPIALATQDRAPVWLDVLDEASLDHDSFDAIVVWNGIDTEPEPVALLARLRQLVRAGGLVALSVAITGSAAKQRDPLAWEGYRAEGQRHHFSRSSLRLACARAGFDLAAMVPARLRVQPEGLSLVERIGARASIALFDALAPDTRYARRIPEVLWRFTEAAEVWMIRPGVAGP
jgi:SAM-dependent methyltransferase